jgi:tripartite ATP-independent transporter DctM subunit
MEWQLVLAAIIITLLILMFSGMPVALAFIIINFVGFYFWVGGVTAWTILTSSAIDVLTTFTLLPVAFFILMGEVLYFSGAIELTINMVDRLIGGVRARLSLLAVGTGTLLGMLTGSSLGSCAALGSTLLPEMEKRGYHNVLTIGPIMGAGGLAMLIPPSAMAVVLASIAQISVGRTLMAGFLPGLLLASMYATYIIFRARLNPNLAPLYKAEKVAISDKLKGLLNLLPMSIIIFLVLGTIFLGIATPTEASAMGALGTFVVTAVYRKLSWRVIKASVMATAKITGMIFLIVMGSKAFGQLLAGSGVSSALLQSVTTLTINKWLMLVSMQLILIIMGMVMDGIAMMMIAIPIFMPIVRTLGFDPIWFAILFLINIEVANLSPPFGMTIFVMKGICPPNITLGDVYRSGIPFMIMQVIAIGLVMLLPQIALWLPNLMR